LALGSGCSAGAPDDDSESELGEDNATAVLEIAPLDIWAQPLPARDTKVRVLVGGEPVTSETTRDGKLRILLGDPADIAVHLEAPLHDPIDVKLTYDGAAVALASDRPATAGVVLGHAPRDVGDRSIPGYDLFLGLRHKWFSAQGRPARRGNDVRLMMDGEETWTAVAADLRAARQRILASTWWWESDFRLLRGDLAAPRAELGDTILGMLEASPADKRVLVGQFDGQTSLTSWLTSDWRLRSHSNDPHFQFMRRGNDTRGQFHFEVKPFSFTDRVRSSVASAKTEALDSDVVQSDVPGHDVDLTQMVGGGAFDLASYHQKFLQIDTDKAFVGGMNFRNNDWDSSDHLVYDARRLPYLASDEDIAKVVGKEMQAPPPRKDYMVRIEGPAAQDVGDVFKTTWDTLLASADAKDAPGRTTFTVDRAIAPRADGIQIQITATMPAPNYENAIAETWFNAVRNARRYIYIEDQYFRVPMLHDAIARRMDEEPSLKLVVVTQAVTNLDPACGPSRSAYAFFAQRYPERFQFLELRSYDPSARASNAYLDINLHSKMLVVDDTFMSVGSANKNNRGLVYEAELNVAIVDPAFVTGARRRIFANLGLSPTDDDAAWWNEMRDASRTNDAIYAAWESDHGNVATAPRGFLYTLGYAGGEETCTFKSVGPDST
jgi:phosphatidylserine/phosphatidylglycerophosphate/cardiolipin synthase-like enzyme